MQLTTISRYGAYNGKKVLIFVFIMLIYKKFCFIGGQPFFYQNLGKIISYIGDKY